MPKMPLNPACTGLESTTATPQMFEAADAKKGTPKKEDWDYWAALGNRGWAWDDVLPLFRSLEDYERGSAGGYGAGGEVRVEGRAATLGSPREAMRAGLAYVPEDRARVAHVHRDRPGGGEGVIIGGVAGDSPHRVGVRPIRL